MRGPFERAARNVTHADDIHEVIQSAESDLPHYSGHPRELSEVAIAISHLKSAAARFQQAAREAHREATRCEEVGRG